MLFGATIFLGSFLLFLIEPLFAKSILPWFGGTAAVWTTCLVFFQTALLAGYLYAHGLTRRVGAKGQRVLHTMLLACSLLFLPVIPAQHWQPSAGTAPALRVLAILIAVIGMPFFVLSTTGPLLQVWSRRKSPYRLFALSNAGALLALLAFPVLLEPNFSRRELSAAWSAGFAAFALLCAISTWTAKAAPVARELRTDGKSMAIWFALAAGGSILLLATTNQLTQNVAAAPFLWIAPLVVYLVTFILCFESSRWYRRGLYSRVLVFAFAVVAYSIYDIQLSMPIFVSIPVFLSGLFAGCMFCHGELSVRKPAPEHLTAFYLMIAAGGAAGAIFVGLLAPWIFTGFYELAASLLFVSGLALILNWRAGWPQRLLWTATTATMAIVAGAQVYAYHHNARLVARNFYGALRVVESGGVRRLYHGTIEHGSQFINPARRAFATTYYGPPSGVGLALRFCCGEAKRVGIVGLGAGTLATYGRAGDQFRYYEIDPEVIRLARSEFSYLGDTAANVQIQEGDARLSLDREPPQMFDVLAVDAFSGDAIPVHLLTEEAFAVYRRHLKPSGILAIHISNQYLDLAPVIGRLAPGAVVVQSEKDQLLDLASATWVLNTTDSGFLSRIESVARPIPARSLRRWTDDYNNLFEALRW